MKYIYFFTALLLVSIFAASCQANSGAQQAAETVEPEQVSARADSNASSAQTTEGTIEYENNASGDYWDGGGWTGQPVVSIRDGISQAAHDLFQSCGLKDRDIEQVVAYHVRQSEQDPLHNESQLAREALDSMMTPMWTRTFSAETLAPGVYRVACSVVENSGNE